MASGPLSGALKLYDCTLPYTVTGAPATKTITPPAPYNGCSQIVVSAPDFYGRKGLSTWPVTVGLSCPATGMTGSTTVTWRAKDLNWDLNTTNDVTYSPYVNLSANPAVVTSGNNVTLNWTIAPFVDGASVTCQAFTNGAPAGWGPSGSGTGSATIPVSSNTTFSLSCTESAALSSAAAAAVTAFSGGPTD
jgi:hypothetical protein